MNIRYPLVVSIGAIFGALSRFYGTEFAKIIFGQDFGFYGTFWINVIGCFLIAYVLTFANENSRAISPELKLMTTTGFCGAFTTFSTYGLETKDFLDKGDSITLLLYFVGSAIVGMVGIRLGVLAARIGTERSRE